VTTIYVTQRDIDQGVKGSDRFCPVANALHRQGYPRPTVTRAEIKLPTGEHWPLPPVAAAAVKRWDDNEYQLRPFQFDL
jgi:hypothetical protein